LNSSSQNIKVEKFIGKMTEEEKNIFVQLSKGIPKPVVYSLITAMVIGIFTFSFAFIKATGKTNAELPIEQTKTNEIKQKVDWLTVGSETIKIDVGNLKQSVIDVKEEQKSQREILLQILYRTNQIDKNTK